LPIRGLIFPTIYGLNQRTSKKEYDQIAQPSLPKNYSGAFQ
jgi:hypothetical protein